MTDFEYPLSGPDRAANAETRRHKAKDISFETPESRSYQTAHNGDNTAYPDTLPMGFSKGLEHAINGFVNPSAFEAMVEGLTQPGTDGETRPEYDVKGPTTDYFVRKSDQSPYGRRLHESPLAGMTYVNMGPDPDMVAMAPAPKLGESELTAEMIEVYAMALVRDMSFAELADGASPLLQYDAAGENFIQLQTSGGAPATVGDMIQAMNDLTWFSSSEITTSLSGSSDVSTLERQRQYARGDEAASGSTVTERSLFRGSSPGCQDGPYISQFLMQGSGRMTPGGDAFAPDSGMVAFGAQSIDQRITPNAPGVDWMTRWTEWLGVQNGLAVGNEDIPGSDARFITTPRDLATYVHVDALYQAYLIAALMMNNQGAPGDDGFPEPNVPDATRAAFATFGGPHVLSLVTEVATRALRAVRRQKFQIHRRARPERLGAMISAAAQDLNLMGSAKPKMQVLLDELGLLDGPNQVTQIMEWINQTNRRKNAEDWHYAAPDEPVDGFELDACNNYLLPMAFPEGSPMHPAYGAGHATVAGACTTVLKAFYNIYDTVDGRLTPKGMSTINLASAFEADPRYPATLKQAECGELTIEGELNKLAANIAIGRNFAGVHYYTDYFDSLRMGERVAIGILKEQMVTYPEPVAMHLRSFDGDDLILETQGDGHTTLSILDVHGHSITEDDWLTRHVREFPSRIPPTS